MLSSYGIISQEFPLKIQSCCCYFSHIYTTKSRLSHQLIKQPWQDQENFLAIINVQTNPKQHSICLCGSPIADIMG